MSAIQERAAGPVAAARPRRAWHRLVQFVCADHRYVLLGTSAVAALGMWLSMRPRPDLSFMRGIYAVEVAMYCAFVAWLVVAGVGLVVKLTKWRGYGTASPFVRPAAKRALRMGSYAVCVFAALLFVDRAVMGLASAFQEAVSAASNPEDFLESLVYMVWNGREVFGRGVATTVGLAILGTTVAFCVAVMLVFLRMQEIDKPDNDLVRLLKVAGGMFARAYSTVVRGTPMMVQALVVYFAGFGVLRGTGMTASEIGGIWSTFVAGLAVISLNSAAYMMEVLRGGIEAVDAGQMEAARSLGLSQWQAMARVVFPQGIKNALPALSNELVVNIKDSSVLSVIGTFDLMFATTTVAGIYYRQLEVYAFAAVTYLALTMCASKVLALLAKRLEVRRPSATPRAAGDVGPARER